MNNSGFATDDGRADYYDGPMVAVACGAMSEGFMVRYRGRRMFVKRLRHEFISEPRYRAAFAKEFELGYSLEHPGIVKYYELRESADSAEILMEYVEGDDLASFIAKNGEYFKRRANFMRFVSQLTSAIDYLHQHGILHLDLKPENIMMTRIDSSVKIIDLGLGFSDMHCDSRGGSPLTSAPETVAGDKGITGAADIYSIGAIMEYIISASGMRVPSRTKSVISRCKAANPADRFEHASDIAAALERSPRSLKFIAAAVAFLLLCAGAYLILNRGGGMAVNVPSDGYANYTATTFNAPADSITAMDTTLTPEPNALPPHLYNNTSAEKADAVTPTVKDAVTPQNGNVDSNDIFPMSDTDKLQSIIAERCRQEIPPLIARYERMLALGSINLKEFEQLDYDSEMFFQSIVAESYDPDGKYTVMFPSLDRNDIGAAIYNAYWNNGGSKLSELSNELIHRINGR